MNIAKLIAKCHVKCVGSGKCKTITKTKKANIIILAKVVN